MGVMVTEVYDALVAAGAPEDKARAAAAVREGAEVADKADIARLDARLGAVEQRLGAIESRLSVVVTVPAVRARTPGPPGADRRTQLEIHCYSDHRDCRVDLTRPPGPVNRVRSGIRSTCPFRGEGRSLGASGPSSVRPAETLNPAPDKSLIRL